MQFRLLAFATFVQIALLTGYAEGQVRSALDGFPDPPKDFKDVTLKCDLEGQWKEDNKPTIPMSALTLIFSLERKTVNQKTEVLVRPISAIDGPRLPPPSITGGSPSKMFFQLTCALGCHAVITDTMIMFTSAANLSEMGSDIGTFSINRYTGEYFGYSADGPTVVVDKGKCAPHTIEKKF